jgi:hypothetical protein
MLILADFKETFTTAKRCMSILSYSVDLTNNTVRVSVGVFPDVPSAQAHSKVGSRLSELKGRISPVMAQNSVDASVVDELQALDEEGKEVLQQLNETAPPVRRDYVLNIDSSSVTVEGMYEALKTLLNGEDA